MSLIVQKFGGTSLASAAKILHAAHLIRTEYDAGKQVIAVLSAQGDTTDRLIAQAKEINPTPALRELDALLATGEQCSAALCAMALHTLHVPAVSLCAWQIPIETDGIHGDAGITEIGRERIDRELSAGNVVLVTGFQGVDAAGDTVTLGRGGSDTSAVALAAAFGAEACRIYTDVDGVYTTDPAVCPHAKRLDRISYDHMRLLASHGAQVLHERSVEVAARCAVRVEVLSCTKGSIGTRVEDSDDPDVPVIGVTRSRAGTSALARITAVGAALPSILAMRTAVRALEDRSVVVCGIEEGEQYFSVFVPHDDAETALAAVHDAFFAEE